MHLYKFFAAGKREMTMCLRRNFLALSKGKKISCILIKVLLYICWLCTKAKVFMSHSKFFGTVQREKLSDESV